MNNQDIQKIVANVVAEINKQAGNAVCGNGNTVGGEVPDISELTHPLNIPDPENKENTEAPDKE